MFTCLGQFVTRRARWILAIGGVILIVAAVVGSGASAKLKSGGFADPTSGSELARVRLDTGFVGQTNLVFLVHARAGTADSPAVAAAGQALSARLAQRSGVTGVTSYWSAHSPALESRNGTEALVLAHVQGNDKVVSDRTKVLVDHLSVPASAAGPVTVTAGGAAGAGNDIGTQIRKDLKLAEGIAIPVTLLLLVVAFGSVVAATLPIAIGVVAIFGTLAALFVLGSLTDVSIYALNLTTALGLGLAIDYSLLMVNRYREELRGGLTPVVAVQRAVETAGRTIVFSAATVAAALAALLVFPVYFLRSFAFAGISVIVIATAAALIVLPAALTVLGLRVNAGAIRRRHRTAVVPGAGGAATGPRTLASPGAGGAVTGPRAAIPGTTESPFWRRVATAVMRRPVAIGVPVIAVLLLVGIPFVHVHFGTPDDRALPTSAAARQVGDALRADFRINDANTVDIVTAAPLGAATASSFATEVSRLPGVAEVTGPTGTFAGGTQVGAAGPAAVRYQTVAGTWLAAAITPDALSAQAAGLVHQVRALPDPGGIHTYVGGQAAELVDQKRALGQRLPLALALIVLTTLLILFLFTGSVVIPVKALALNALSLTAVFGAMVWVFQYGHLSGLLGFTPTPTSTTMPLLLFCIAFGLSMDYEVFLLSRIKELHDAGATNTEAVAGGLARTGRLVTTAAALLTVTFFAFGLSKVSFIQLFGFGTGLAILIDATVIRGVLVPAFMGLAGDLNWWAPRPLRRLYRRAGLSETPIPPETPEPRRPVLA